MATKSARAVEVASNEIEREDDRKSIARVGSTHRSMRSVYCDAYAQKIFGALQQRSRHKIYQNPCDLSTEATPKFVIIKEYVDKFRKLNDIVLTRCTERLSRVNDFDMQSRALTLRLRSTVTLNFTMNQIIQGINDFSVMTEPYSGAIQDTEKHLAAPETPLPPYIRISLHMSPTILLYTQLCQTVAKGTKDAEIVEEENRWYDFLTVGKGKVRRRSEAEAQTTDILRKSREINTDLHPLNEQSAYVSYFEMYDTIQEVLEREANVDGTVNNNMVKRLPLKAYSKYEQLQKIVMLPEFHHHRMVLERCLAGNTHSDAQKHYRNLPKDIVDEAMNATEGSAYKYALRLLFKFPTIREHGLKAATSFSFCSGNSDIVAVSYGIFSYASKTVAKSGSVHVWSIKNPDTPERSYYYSEPVVTVAFSPYLTSLIAIGLFDGSIEVRDICELTDVPIAVTQRSAVTGIEPVMSIKWMQQSDAGVNEIDPFLSLSQDGTVTKFRIINSPYLMAFKQITLERVQDSPEGLSVPKITGNVLPANPHPQGVALTKHPIYADIFYLCTDEGCVHKCSTNTHQYLEVWRTHASAIGNMDFSPWSPKLFLTCGNDWTIRVWLEGIHKPLVTLKHQSIPVHCAFWSRTHSTIIISMNRKSIDIWDIQKTTLHPMSSHSMDNTVLTMAEMSPSGKSIAVGNEQGYVSMYTFDDMPMPLYMQYEFLEQTLAKAVECSPTLSNELKAIGYFGYPGGVYMKPK